MSSAFAAKLPPACRVPPTPGHPHPVLQADGSTRLTGGVVAARLVLGYLVEDTCFVEFDVDCDEDLILGQDWLRL